MKSTSLALVEGGDATREQLDLLKSTIAPGASDDKLRMFLAICAQRKLDPFLKQIYYHDRGKGGVPVMVSIDGLRLLAARTGEYQGQTPPQWCGRDGVWHDVWVEGYPVAARVGVLREGFAGHLYRVAHWREYAQLDGRGNITQMWQRMPSLMLAKCAEALALRAAFPEEMSGCYTPEEMSADAQDAQPQPQQAKAAPAKAIPAQTAAPAESTDVSRARGRFFAVMKEIGLMAGRSPETSKEEWRQFLSHLLDRPVLLARDLKAEDWMEAIRPVLRLRSQMGTESGEAAYLAAINAACGTEIPAISQVSKEQWEKTAVAEGADPFADDEEEAGK